MRKIALFSAILAISASAMPFSQGLIDSKSICNSVGVSLGNIYSISGKNADPKAFCMSIVRTQVAQENIVCSADAVIETCILHIQNKFLKNRTKNTA
jgi:hypothetical protein